MAFFDADKAVNNSNLDELNIFQHQTENGEKKGILYFSRGDVTIEMAAVIKNKGGEESGTINALACKTGDDEPTWDIGNMSYDFDQFFTKIADGKLDKVITQIFDKKDTIWGSHFDDKLFGFDGDDTVKGWRGDDSLNGGKGKDLLKGNYGDDTFVFDQDLKNSNVDTIHKFNVKDDSIELDQDIFTGLEKGGLHEKNFHAGKHAKGDEPQVLYKKDHLYFDADGAGEGEALKFAKIGKGKDITHDDFFVS